MDKEMSKGKGKARTVKVDKRLRKDTKAEKRAADKKAGKKKGRSYKGRGQRR